VLNTPSRIIRKIDLETDSIDTELEVLSSKIKIEEEYDEYSSGYWQNISLWNRSGCENNTLYSNFNEKGKKTGYCNLLPTITSIVEENFDLTYLKMVRVRTLKNAVLVPHRDFVELDDKVKYFRVFVPLNESKYAYHGDEHSVFRMRLGEVWYLNAALIHSAVNLQDNNRVHLCLDFAFDRDFHPSDIFLNPENFNVSHDVELVKRSVISDSEINRIIDGFSLGIDKHNFKDTLFFLSKIYYTYDISITTVYQWLVHICARSDNQELIEKSQKLQNFMLNHRTLNERFEF